MTYYTFKALAMSFVQVSLSANADLSNKIKLKPKIRVKETSNLVVFF